ncbi:hypothetical protein X945_5764 [Burkholderia pseudomallei ABCPW 107]|nr:hypothetical protein X945_5764 [Burkholderia pseudomallei ABCPW 107]
MGDPQLTLRRFLRLLDKGVQHNDLLPHMRAIEHPPDTFPTLGAQFKQPVTHCS